jgi:putative tryptophan/tyrosine transport system substrate-binding protein
MRRRHFTSLLGGATATWPFAAHTQQKAMQVIGYLYGGPSGYSTSDVAGFRRGLDETGYVEGQNVAIEYRWADGRFGRLPALAADLVGRKVGVIAAIGGRPVAHAAKNATSTIPIVFVSGSDPVVDGLVASLARPGGNVTGVSILVTELNPKRLELLLELVPQKPTTSAATIAASLRCSRANGIPLDSYSKRRGTRPAGQQASGGN